MILARRLLSWKVLKGYQGGFQIKGNLKEQGGFYEQGQVLISKEVIKDL